MATSKTLTPTNVTIQIPEFTDQPDQRVNSNCIDKEADAINALNTAITNIGTIVEKNVANQTLNANGQTIYANNSITLAAGTWMICGTALVSKAVAGSRQGLTLATSNTAGQYNSEIYDLRYQQSDNSVNQYYNVFGIVRLTESTTYYAMVFNGNVSANVSTWLRAVRIK